MLRYMSRRKYTPAWWLRGPHLQTLWGKFARRRPFVPTRLERWTTPDDDFVEVHRLHAANGRPRLVVFHGLEGTFRSHYARGLLHEAGRRGWGADLLLFRSCGSELNKARRLYHSGETTDAAWFLEKVASEFPDSRIGLVGVSLGGNVLLKYLGEHGRRVPGQIAGAVAISVPFDLYESSLHINRGFSRVYQWHFLRSLREKAIAKLATYPDFADRVRLQSVRTMFDFDDVVTAPVHGFADAHDYYRKSSSIRWLNGISVPSLLLNAFDDPFLPPAVLEQVQQIAENNDCITMEFPNKGGHVGFVAGRSPFTAHYYAELRALDFLEDQLTSLENK